jgi:hypothetical protein
MAFFATAISPIMPISTFGIFSAMVHISASASERAC